MTWRFYRAQQAFYDYRQEWDELNKRCGNHILLDSRFVHLLIHYFASRQTLLGVSSNGSTGFVILEKARPGFWQTFQPSQGPLGLLLLDHANKIESQVDDLIRALPGYSLGVSILQQDPDFTAFANIKSSRTTDICDYAATSRILLSGSFEEFWRKTGRYFVDDLRRQTRRLEEQNVRVQFIAERDPEKVMECVRDYARLETSGWKGREGSAVTAEGPQGLFYRDVLERFCRRGEAVIYRLLFNDQVVASDLCLERDGVTVVLKIAYDENLPGISPGKFIHREILKHLFERGTPHTLEWYGRVNEWQRKLGSTPRMMFHVNFYRHDWVPIARQMMKRGRGLIRRNNNESQGSASGSSAG